MLTIQFKCSCTKDEQTMEVREREPEEPIELYMNYIQRVLGDWHRGRLCLSTKLEYLKIPIPQEGRIGDRPETKH